jgi:hypothetical protein
MAHKPLAAFFGPGPLELLPDYTPGGQAGLPGGFGKPGGKLRSEADCQCITHLSKL